LVAAALTLWPTSLGSVVSGLIMGSLGAMLALGMAFIYRANNTVSFAQAELGTLPATMAIVVMEVWGFTWWMSLVGGLAVALVVGTAVEFLFIRRFFAAPPLMGTVATIGVAQLLVFGSVMFPAIWDLSPAIRTFDPPFDVRFTIGAVVFDANDLIALVIAPLVMVGLGVMLRYTSTGVALRAAASNHERASGLGIPVKRLQTQVWALAAAMSFLAIFLQAGMTGLPPGGMFTWMILARALAAMVIGRMSRLGVIVASSIALGLLQNSMERAGDGALVGPVLLGVVLIALLAQRRNRSRVADGAGSAFALAPEQHRLRPEIAANPRVRVFRGAIGVVVVAAVVAVPMVMGTAGTIKASAVVVFAMIGLSMVVLSGWAGQVSLGQMAFAGLGGAVSAWGIVERGLDPLVAMVVASACGALLAVVIGIPALRLRGLQLAVVTLALAVAASGALFSNAFVDWIPRGGFRRPDLAGRWSIDSPARLYYFALVVAVLVGLSLRSLRASRFGRALIAQRDNERAAASYGVGVTTVKLGAFAISGAIAALAGSIFTYQQAAFRSELFDVNASVTVFVAAVVGGLASPLGGVLGAVYLRGAQWVLPGNWQLLATSAGVLMVLLMVPDGLAGVWTRARNQLIAVLIGGPVDARDRSEPPGRDPDRTTAGIANGDDEGEPEEFHHEPVDEVFVPPEGVVA
ncbi:MAG: ABC transporter permease, partial [Actinobacteria bacterium]|nr:ABC transporter permease [Actinomycetota bacterium]